MWLVEERADEMAARIVAQSENVSLGTIGSIVDMLLASIVAPPLAPFLIVWAVVSVPLDKLGKRLQRGERRMPEEWFAHVEAKASSDGRFFVGRMLKEKGRVTMDDAMRFVAIEKWATKRERDDELLVHASDARKALMDHYEANRSGFDKAVAGMMSGMSSAADTTLKAGVAALTALKRKIDVGF